MIFSSKSYHSYSIRNASFRNDIFQLHRSNHGDENSEQISEWSLHIHNASDA